ncbi:oxidoreductase [Thermaurantiacus sp.]
MTCVAHVAREGQGFPGQPGIWPDRHGEGLARLASALRARGAVASVQLDHGGLRADPKLTGMEVPAPFDDPETGGRALSAAEIERVADAFAAAAARAEQAGFDGVELEAAHGDLRGQFLKATRAPPARMERGPGRADAPPPRPRRAAPGRAAARFSSSA